MRVKLGLDTFTTASKEVGGSILKLLEFAKERVLRAEWRTTKVQLIDNSSRFAKEQQCKKKRMQGDKAVTRSIPIDIVESVLMRMNPKDAVRLSTTCKNWRATAPRYDPTMSKIPWLLIIADDFYTLQSIIDENMSFKIEIPSFFRGRKFNGDASHGWLVLRSKQSDIVSLLNPFSRARLDLPALNCPGAFFLHMSSPPTNPDCILLLVDAKNLYIWRPGDKSWNIEKNVNGRFYKSIIRIQEQFYAIVVPDFELVTFQVRPLRVKKLDVPPPIDIDNLMEYDLTLVESGGKILLVCIHSSLFFTADRDNSKELNVILFQLDLKNEIWIKMESLGDQTLFLKNKNNQTISISSPEAKCCGNSIYFIDNWSRDVYFIEKHSIRIVSRGSFSINRRLWITPNLI
ncbi:unnamed protein product [Musa acuminata subsp. malaccensis]|uniref:(wild Malaysian banana) hypothetical protein n=1 Tax=Musa acuminata subsp. malaccensis TaxID=214687 RepID=A0A8D7F6N5_MUSAM|nr:unnamed protein product [Musa acuminata subsp. malaccensis]